jgi:hypothetical protein
MFRKNDQHLQIPLLSSIDSLPDKQLKRLEASWAGTFYREYFSRIDEAPFALLYSDEPSRPNIPINVLAGLESLKSGFGWSDEEMYDHYCFDVQVRYALGYRDLSEGHFELRTMYNFRQRITQHMQETGVNLFDQAFEQVSDEQVVAYQLKTNKLRMDSTQIASNIRDMSRLQLLVEVVQRVHRMLDESDQARYADEFGPYLKGSSGQYIYHIKGEETAPHLQAIGELMHKLLDELSARYADEHTYQILQRVFREHFVVEETGPRAKAGQDLSAASLQSPDDWEATYRQKRGEGHVGYVANVTETCHPDNPFQLIVKIQTESNNTDDAAMLAEALPELKERTDVDEMHTDGGYNSSDVDAATHEHHVEQIQTAIRGAQPAPDKLNLDDFEWMTDAEGQAQTATCPQGQQADVIAGRTPQRFCAAFQNAQCQGCPLLNQCPTRPRQRRPQRVLQFSQQQLNVALRRKRLAKARVSGNNLRSAVEATVRAVKHPFAHGKVPVRGIHRVSMVMIGAAVMNNVRQIHRYLTDQSRSNQTEKIALNSADALRPSLSSFFARLWSQVRARLCSLDRHRPTLAFQA